MSPQKFEEKIEMHSKVRKEAKYGGIRHMCKCKVFWTDVEGSVLGVNRLSDQSSFPGTRAAHDNLTGILEIEKNFKVSCLYKTIL
jgi:hypothetical protein